MITHIENLSRLDEIYKSIQQAYQIHKKYINSLNTARVMITSGWCHCEREKSIINGHTLICFLFLPFAESDHLACLPSSPLWLSKLASLQLPLPKSWPECEISPNLHLYRENRRDYHWPSLLNCIFQMSLIRTQHNKHWQ